jgi:surface protein
MAIDFPNSPTTNQTYTVAGRTWTYDGQKWVVNSAGGRLFGLIPPTIPDAWVRPTDWLTLPTLTAGQQKFVGLFKVDETNVNPVTVWARGNYTVDWGDGSTPQNVATGITVERNIQWADAPSSSLTSDGFRQVIVTVTPQAGQNLTELSFDNQHSTITGGAGVRKWLDIAGVGSELTGLYMSAYDNFRWTSLKKFTFVGPSKITNMYALFFNCVELRQVDFEPSFTSYATTTRWMFINCYQLRSIPPMDTANVTNMNSMFEACMTLTSLPPMDTSNVTNMEQTFSFCYNLEYVPVMTTTANVTNMKGMFRNSYKLRSIPPMDTSNVTTMQNMFLQCKNLQSAPELDTSNVTNMSGMFDGCDKIESVPHYDTALVTDMGGMFANSQITTVPAFNMQNVTTAAYMFYGCYKLKEVPQFATPNLTNAYFMFAGAHALETVPGFDTSKVTTMVWMFRECRSLRNLGSFSTAKATNVADMLHNCWALETVPDIGPIRPSANISGDGPFFYAVPATTVDLIPVRSFDFRYLSLSSAELNRIYGRLPTLTARTITGVTAASGTVTYTTSVAHGYRPGMAVTVTGVTPSGYNLANVEIDATPTATTFTVVNAATGTYTSGGTVTPAALTLQVSFNWGTSGDDPTIATAKGWTISG